MSPNDCCRALVAATEAELNGATTPFATAFDPIVARLQQACVDGHPLGRVPEVVEYFRICRLPFRRLEYSFVLNGLDAAGRAPLDCLDLGCGATPLPHVIALRGHRVHACDFDGRLMADLERVGLASLLGTDVRYSREDATQLSFSAASFDVVTCVSVLEHVPSPGDAAALREAMRVLRPGGLLLMTVDFAPDAGDMPGRARRTMSRLADVMAQEGAAGLVAAWRRKRVAAQVGRGSGKPARSANQPFDLRHIEEIVLPAVKGAEPASIPFAAAVDLESVSRRMALALWALPPSGLVTERPIVPVTVACRKPHSC